MKTSKQGVELIAGFEGFVGHPYRDAVGVLTVGFGHTGPDTARVGTITRAQGLALLARDLPRYEHPVNALGLALNQNQFDALVSFVYNVGPGYIGHGHTIGDALHAHAWHAAADAFLLYDKGGGRTLPGLTRRRQAERALFLRHPARRAKPLTKAQKWQARLDKVRDQAREHGWTKALKAEGSKLKAAIKRSKR
jgi:lysozyme